MIGYLISVCIGVGIGIIINHCRCRITRYRHGDLNLALDACLYQLSELERIEEGNNVRKTT